jgi:hypothetical protein
MKKLILGMVSILMCAASFAQTVRIQFRGNQGKNYRVMIDGVRYFSNDAGVTYASYRTANNTLADQRTLTLTNLLPGTHRIQIYNNANTTNNTSGQLIYTNNFQLREDYDMNIVVNGNRISFSEKINPSANANGQYRTAMTTAGFNELIERVRQSRYQDTRISSIRAALSTTDYFTTDQISRLLTLVNAESARLDLAKTAYAVAADPTNYYNELYHLFDSQSYRNSLDAYVRAQAAATVETGGSTTAANRILLSSEAYNQLLLNLNNNNYQSGKYNIISNAFSNTANAFTTAQIRQLLGAITSEPDRLYLAKQAYPTVSDAGNFHSLLTLFPTQSNREELNAFIISNGGIGNNSLVITRTPMSESDFNVIYRKVGNHFRGSSRYTELKAAFNDTQNNFTSAQIRQMLTLVNSGSSLLGISESNRVELAKLSYARVTDPGNFSQVIDLFSSQTSKDQLNNYIRIQVNQ